MTGFEFASPWLMLAAAAAVLPIALRRAMLARLRDRATVRYSDVGRLTGALPRPSFFHRHGLAVLRLSALALIVLALGRPRLSESIEELLTRGIDILLCLDVSGSMLAEDMEPKNRMDAAKLVLDKFVAGRKSDRIGLVIFSGRAYTQCPLTTDYGVLRSLLRRADPALIREEGTAIGMGLATGVNRLRDSEASSRVMVLVTDGRNNAGKLEPATSAELAKALGIKVYVIGVGGRGRARVPAIDPKTGRQLSDPFTGQPMYGYTDEDLNEPVLRDVASKTGGLYFRATDTSGLESVFAEIDRLEKTDVKTREYQRHTELFAWLTGAALALLLLEALLANTRLRRIP